jgi:hypothetical protein
LPISSPKISGIADKKVARAIRQLYLTLRIGITDDYIGQIDDDLYTARVEDVYENKQALSFGVPFKKAKLDEKEIIQYCTDNNIDSSLESGCQNVQQNLYTAQQSAWLEEEKNREGPKLLVQRMPSQVNAALVGVNYLQNQGITVTSKSSPAPTTKVCNGDDDCWSLVDPRLLPSSGGQGITLEGAQDVMSSKLAPSVSLLQSEVILG